MDTLLFNKCYSNSMKDRAAGDRCYYIGLSGQTGGPFFVQGGKHGTSIMVRNQPERCT